jgi:outer membrane receptor protein involved in Fe transport
MQPTLVSGSAFVSAETNDGAGSALPIEPLPAFAPLKRTSAAAPYEITLRSTRLWHLRRRLGASSASRFTYIDSYSVTNATVGYRFTKGWEVDVFARNLFEEQYITALTIQIGNSGLILGQPGEPRTVGLTFRFAK